MNIEEVGEQMDDAILGLALRSLVQEVRSLKKQVEELSAKLGEVHEQTTAMVEKIGW
jgi:uncharacterized coiled-coil DUF342 family protein